VTCEQGKAPAKIVAVAAKPENEVFESDLYGACRAEYYTEKSYIRRKDPNGKWRVIIGWSN